jgi:hypothetical protein
VPGRSSGRRGGIRSDRGVCELWGRAKEAENWCGPFTIPPIDHAARATLDGMVDSGRNPHASTAHAGQPRAGLCRFVAGVALLFSSSPAR